MSERRAARARATSSGPLTPPDELVFYDPTDWLADADRAEVEARFGRPDPAATRAPAPKPGEDVALELGLLARTRFREAQRAWCSEHGVAVVSLRALRPKSVVVERFRAPTDPAVTPTRHDRKERS